MHGRMVYPGIWNRSTDLIAFNALYESIHCIYCAIQFQLVSAQGFESIDFVGHWHYPMKRRGDCHIFDCHYELVGGSKKPCRNKERDSSAIPEKR
jgi:hypothetical protein